MPTLTTAPPPGAAPATPPVAPLSEARLLLLLGAVQFVNVVDFVMVLPLGPDFARALAIPTHQLGLVAGSYTASAAIAGLVAASFLDRFDRRRALLLTMLGLVSGTAAGGFAIGLDSMLLARVLAGMFGGPATSLAMSILSDAIPPERRGRALGKVMGAFSVASVVGVPAGLELARLGGWRLPFFVIATLGLAVALGVWALMPPMRAHLRAAGDRRAPARPVLVFLRDRVVLLSLLGTAVAMAGSFSIISNLSAFVQFNLGYPRDGLGVLYMAGGGVSFFSMRLAGRAVDRWGAPRGHGGHAGGSSPWVSRSCRSARSCPCLASLSASCWPTRPASWRSTRSPRACPGRRIAPASCRFSPPCNTCRPARAPACRRAAWLIPVADAAAAQ